MNLAKRMPARPRIQSKQRPSPRNGAEMTQEQKAATTLHYFSQQSTEQPNHSNHCNPSNHRYFDSNNSWNNDPQSRTSLQHFQPDSRERRKQRKHLRSLRPDQKETQWHESPSNMLLQLTKSLKTMQPNREYKVRVKARCSVNGFAPTQPPNHNQPKVAYIRKPDTRLKLRCSNHIIPTPQQNRGELPQKGRSQRKEGNAIKKIKRDIIRSLESKIQRREYIWKNLKEEVQRGERQRKNQAREATCQSFYMTGLFRQSIKLKPRRKIRVQTEVTPNQKRIPSQLTNAESADNQKASFVESEESQLLVNLLQLQQS